MPTTWAIAIDWDRDGHYTQTYDDVTNRIMQINWFLGMRKPYQDTADNSLLALVLNNSDHRFSPENAASPLAGKVVPQRPIQIISNPNTGNECIHWKGWIETIQPAVNQYGQRVTKIVANGVMQFYKAAETNIELQENKRADEIIGELIKEVVIPPAVGAVWVLGRIGNSELDLTTRLSSTAAYSNLDQPEAKGKLTFDMAADNWVRDGGLSNVGKDTFDVYMAIQDITAAEHGKFLFDREGKALIWNRHHLLDGAVTPAAAFDNTMTDMVYTYAGIDQCKNEITVICHPRTISASADTVLWELGDAIIRVEPGKTRSVYVKYEDEAGKRIGARDVTVGEVEYERGTATITVDAKANGAEIKLVNSGTTPAVVNKLTIEGRKIVDSGEMEAKAIDQASIIDYGRRTMRINLPSIDSLEHAQYIADFERDRRKQPRGEVSALTVLSHGKNGGGHHDQQLALTLGDLVTVEETQTAHDRNYYIIGEAHELTHGATLWKTTWYLEPAPDVYPWKLGDTNLSLLGQTTRLTY